ncbi:MAG: hypothetical protein CVU88_00595 [Firmicutes bacterium HGW-Firmicutes-13]|nr:MAG: hypothetical protein CVU88_00595 [Firmicutes bacterium HGW-Firmicutes-13]
MKRVLFLSAVILVVFFLSGQTGLSRTGAADVKNLSLEDFPYMSEQTVPSDHNSFFILEIEPPVFGTMTPSLRDLRLFAGEHELGYALLPVKTYDRTILRETKRLEVINQGVLQDGRYSFVVLTGGIEKNESIKVKLDQDPYLVKGTLYGSNDSRSWQKLRTVTFFSIDNQYSEIPLSGIDYDYLKIDFQQPPGEMLAVGEVFLISPVEIKEKDISSWEEAPFEMDRDEHYRESILAADLLYGCRLSSEWVLGTSEKGFHRQVIMEGSNSKEDWEFLWSTYVYRGVEPGDEKLSFSYEPVHYRYLRLRIIDGDSEPLPVDSVKVRTHPVRVLVKRPSAYEGTAVDLRAYWGDEKIGAPFYDVGELVDSLDLGNYPVVFLSRKVDNLDYRPPKPDTPLTERYPFLLTLGLIAAVLIIALILYRNVKQVNS